MKRPLISIIINCHNGEEYLEEAINSVFEQTYQRWEIIFFDNNSNDNTKKITEKYTEKLVYFRSNKFLRLYEARNLAINLCKGDLVCFLDSDDIWVAEKLEVQLSHYSDEFPIVYGGYQQIDKYNNRSKIYLSNYSGKITKKLLKRNFISIGCILIKSELLKSYKFDSYFELLGDYELWVRLSSNYKFASTNSILEYSRDHEKNITKTKSFLLNNERRYFYKKLFKYLPTKYFAYIIILATRYELKILINLFSWLKR